MVDNRGPELVAVCSVFVSLSAASVFLRVYVRTFIVKAFGWDDAWMIVALLAHILFAGSAIGGVKFGTGRHMSTLSGHDKFMAMRYWWLCYIGYCWAMIAAKLSIGLFLLRITTKPIHKWIIYTVMGLNVLCGFVFFFVTLFQCWPISFFWNKNQDGYCVPIDVIIGLTFLYSAVSVICDFTFALLPFFLIWNLNMSVRTRIMLIPILGMACIASIAVVVRFAYIMTFKDPDFLWATLDIAIWSDTEQGLGITAGSLATLRPLFRQIGNRLGISSGTSAEPSKSNGRRTPQWSPPIQSNRSKYFPSFGSLLRSENGTVNDRNQEYGMGDLQPVRLRDDLIDRKENEKSDKGFSSWAVHSARNSDDEYHTGGITVQTHIHRDSERL